MTRGLTLAAAVLLAVAGCGGSEPPVKRLSHAECARLDSIATQWGLMQERVQAVNSAVHAKPPDLVSARIDLGRAGQSVSVLSEDATHLEDGELRDSVISVANTLTRMLDALSREIAAGEEHRGAAVAEQARRVAELKPRYERQRAAVLAAVERVDDSGC